MDEARPPIEAIVAEAVAPLLREIEALQRRVTESERRSLVAEAALAPLPPAPALVAAAPREILLPRAPITVVAVEGPAAPVLLDGSIDGTRRQRRAIALFALAVLVLFGGVLGSLALSYV